MKYIISGLLLFTAIFTVRFVQAENLDNKTAWKISASSDSNSSVANVIDGSSATYWHSWYKSDDTNTITQRDEPLFRLTITLPEAQALSGIIYTPRQDLSIGRAKRVNVYLSADSPETARLVKSSNIFSSFKIDSTISFGKTYEAKYIVFEITETSDGYGTVAELNLVKGTGTVSEITGEVIAPLEDTEESELVSGVSVIDREDITVYVSSDTGDSKGNMLDGKKDTYWHSWISGDENGNVLDQTYPPYELTFDFGKNMTVSGFIYTPRQDRDLGRMLSYELYAANYGSNDYYMIDEGISSASGEDFVAEFSANVRLGKLKLVITGAMANYGTCAEMNFIAPDGTKETKALSEYTKERMIIKENIISAVTTYSGEKPLALITDKVTTTYYLEEDVSREFDITVELIKPIKLSGFSLIPYRRYDHHGLWQSFDVYTSLDGSDFVLAGEDCAMEASNREQFYEFTSDVNAKYVRFVIKEYKGNAIALAELSLYQSISVYKEDMDAEARIYRIKEGETSLIEESLYSERTIIMDGAAYADAHDFLVPLSAFDDIGAETSYDSNEQKIYISYADSSFSASFELRIWDNVIKISDSNPDTYDTVKYTMRTEPRFYNDIPYVPFDYIMKHLGFDVINEGGTVTTTSAAMKEVSKIQILESEELFPVERDEITPLDTWIISADAVNNDFADCIAENAMDGNTDTRWVGPYIGYASSSEHYMIIDMRESYITSGIRIYLSNWTLYNSYPTEVSVYVSDDGESWNLQKAESFPHDETELVLDVNFAENIQTRYIKCSVTDTVGTGTSDAGVVYISELRVLEENGYEVTLSMVADAAKKSSGKGIMRFVAEFIDIPVGVDVEYYGIYILPTAAFDGVPAFTENIPYVKFSVTPYEGGTFSADLDEIPAEYYNMPVTAVAFVKQKNKTEYVYTYLSDEMQTVSMLSLLGNLGHGSVEYEEVK